MNNTLENKTFYFMGGLPRSGSTLLTAILNQHPKVYASPSSNLLDMYFALHHGIYDSESYKMGLRQKECDNTLQSLGNLFYSNIKKPVIIDKNRHWGTPGNIPAQQMFNKNPKTIFILRPILEVLSSFVKLAEKNPSNYIDHAIANEDFFVKYYREVNDVRCEWLMKPENSIGRSLLAIGSSLKNPKNNLFIWYADLITNPQMVLNKIHQFIGVNSFEYNFENIKQLDKHIDYEGIKDLHTIQSKIHSNKIQPENFLSEYVINKYKNALDFIPGGGK
jgi:sulfotransferase